MSTNSIESILFSSIQDIAIRNEVEETLKSVLIDVEQGEYLRNQLIINNSKTNIENVLTNQSNAYEEAHALERDGNNYRASLADSLVKDLVTINEEFHELHTIKSKYEAMALQYNELKDKLQRTQSDLKDTQQQLLQQQSSVKNNDTSQIATSKESTSSKNKTNDQDSVLTDGLNEYEQEQIRLILQQEQEELRKQQQKQQQEQQQKKQQEDQQERPKLECAPTEDPVAPSPPDDITPTVIAPVVSVPSDASATATVELQSVGEQGKVEDAQKRKQTEPAPIENEGQNDNKDTKINSSNIQDQSQDAPVTNSNNQAENPAAATTVALVALDSDAADATVGLEDMDMELLMRIFGFLDAMEILNTAQTNISMYSRVDSLFGLGSTVAANNALRNSTNVDVDENVDQSSIGNSTISTTTATAQQPQPSTTASTATTMSTSTATAAAKPSASSTTSAQQATTATIPAGKDKAKTGPLDRKGLFGLGVLPTGGLRIPGVNYAAAAASSLPAVAASAGVSAGASGKKEAANASAVGAASGFFGRAVRQNNSNPSGAAADVTLSSAMANSMAEKLNDQEINAIISMTDKLRKARKEVQTLAATKEELEGKLKGTEAVKDFLMNKVRDLELIVNNNNETEKKVTQQIASDQEVIAFLDGRVQELETQIRSIRKEKVFAIDELEKLQTSTDKKIVLLSDMLQFEREKIRENEREWKVTKKLLIKEVKNCRLQIMSLQAERDGYREQNLVLQKSVGFTPGISGTNASSRSPGGANNSGLSSSIINSLGI